MTVFPDIIVHTRRETKNLLVIEAKKDHASVDTNDHWKLEEFQTHEDYEYQYAVLSCSLEDGAQDRSAIPFRDGMPVEAEKWVVP